MLKLNNVEVIYKGSILVLRGVSFEVSESQIISVLGANGAGKSTSLKAISGLLKTEEGEVTDGSIEFNEKRIDHDIPEDIVKLGITQVFEGRRMFTHLTVDENLKVGASTIKDNNQIKQDKNMVYSYFPGISKYRSSVSGYLSGGEQQMLAIGRAMMAKPKLMLLDEPSLGLAPLVVRELFNIIRKFNKEQKVAIIIVEQNALAALRIASYGYVMENGRIVLDGSSEAMMQNEDVKEFYLGLSEKGQKKNYREGKHYKRRKRWMA